MNLRQRKMGMLIMHFLRAPAISQVIKDNLDHFDIGFVYPGAAL